MAKMVSKIVKRAVTLNRHLRVLTVFFIFVISESMYVKKRLSDSDKTTIVKKSTI